MTLSCSKHGYEEPLWTQKASPVADSRSSLSPMITVSLLWPKHTPGRSAIPTH